jgi:aldehyde dehydrogenase (NAD+)
MQMSLGPTYGRVSPLAMVDTMTLGTPTGKARMAAVASVVPYGALDEALTLLQQCPFRLGASVFGPTAMAQAVAHQLPAQVVTINNLIVPTADPRLPFGGSGAAGFGVTRGTAGLRQLTKLRVITTGGSQLHLSQRPVPLGPLKALMRWLYG